MSPTRDRCLIACASVFFACATTSGPDDDGAGNIAHDDAPASVVLTGSELAAELDQSPPRAIGDSFRRIGLVWTGDSPTGFEISTSTDGATWSRWKAPTLRHTEVEEEATYIGELALPESATHYRLRATRDQRPSVVQLQFFSRTLGQDLEIGDPAGQGGLDSVSQGLGSIRQALSIGGVEVHARSEWGARDARCTSGHTPRRITVHHTDTPNRDTSVKARLRQIQAHHQDVRGWCDIGYHFLISSDGQIWEGRPVDRLGSHVGGRNSGNIGISFIGTYTTTEPSAAQLQSASSLIAGLGNQLGIPTDDISGHRDFKSTDCPGQALYNLLPSLSGGPSAPTAPPRPPDATTVTLRGVVFESGNPQARVPGATVTIGSVTVTTDAEGTYEVDVSPGTVQVAVSAKGFRPATLTREVSDATEWGSIELSAESAPDTAAVVGVVFGRGKPAPRVAGATVFLDSGRSVVADSEGLYRFEGLPPGPVTVRASAKAAGSGQASATLSNGSATRIDIHLDSDAEVTPPPPVAASCESRCGSTDSVPGSTPECFCDARCVAFGDCCGDRDQVCAAAPETGSCASSCFSPLAVPFAAGQCYCDAACTRFEDCCGDFDNVCSAPPAPSCSGLCGTATAVFGPAGPCYCDPLCAANGDCCGDFDAVCTSGDGPSCTGHCGSADPLDDDGRDCFCDASCTDNGDCCGDFASVCSS